MVTDHKPLTAILGPKKGIPSLAAARLQRWAIILSDYEYDIQYKSTEEHSNADGLSRLPLRERSPPQCKYFQHWTDSVPPCNFQNNPTGDEK